VRTKSALVTEDALPLRAVEAEDDGNPAPHGRGVPALDELPLLHDEAVKGRRANVERLAARGARDDVGLSAKALDLGADLDEALGRPRNVERAVEQAGSRRRARTPRLRGP
jgi:hypothetical protein